MKKILTSMLALVMLTTAIASPGTPVNPDPRNAANIMIAVGKDGKKISLLELSTISKADLEKLTGKKMTGMQKMAFKGAQKKFKKGIDENGNITSKKLQRAFYAGESGFHLGGFALGFFLGLIGVLLAYVVFDDDYKQNRIKWSWIGLAAGVVIGLLLFFVAFNTVKNSIP